MAWPGEESRPGSRAPEAIGDFGLIARTIARFEPVLMLAYPEFVGHAEAACGPNVEVVELAFDDVWIRDSGPLFAVRGGKELVAVDFRFNRYGWKMSRANALRKQAFCSPTSSAFVASRCPTCSREAQSARTARE